MDSIIRRTIPTSLLKAGDTVEINGVMETVGAEYLKRNTFMGATYKGSAHHKGITRVTFVVPLGKGRLSYE